MIDEEVGRRGGRVKASLRFEFTGPWYVMLLKREVGNGRMAQLTKDARLSDCRCRME